MYKSVIKRILDITVSLSVALLFLPILLVLAVLIKLDSKGPLFFTQIRVGRGLRTFKVIKLRTMIHENREVGDKPLIGKVPGVTRVGYFLRRFKIDEFPQVINVLKGDMSVVGPRPSIAQQLQQMTDKEIRRYAVRPGLTGLSQVSGNIHLTWKERYYYDLIYIDNISLTNDLRIILKTFLIIFRGEEKFLHKPTYCKHNVNENPN